MGDHRTVQAQFYDRPFLPVARTCWSGILQENPKIVPLITIMQETRTQSSAAQSAVSKGKINASTRSRLERGSMRAYCKSYTVEVHEHVRT